MGHYSEENTLSINDTLFGSEKKEHGCIYQRAPSFGASTLLHISRKTDETTIFLTFGETEMRSFLEISLD